MTIRYEGQDATGPRRETDGLAGFRRWKAKQGARRATAPADDELYAQYVAAASGEDDQRDTGRVRPQVDGGVEVPPDLSDDAAYRLYMDELTGVAARRRSEAAVRQDRADRREEWQRHADQHSNPMRPQYAD